MTIKTAKYDFISKLNSNTCYDRRPVGQSVLVLDTHQRPVINSFQIILRMLRVVHV
jgi:hypothetical protein